MKDFTDGKVFRSNKFFQENKKCLQIILYQDSFEIVNPIGSAKKKHKVLAVYMNIGNIPDHLRSHINTIKLVALCKEVDFNHKQVYGKLVEDLKILEESGIEVNTNVIKGSLAFITGDNLGSHALGGFVENFSTTQYFCRFCLVTKNEFHSDVSKIHEPRTIESYNRAVDQADIDKNFEGVKFNSVFNELNNYHVCSPGLPPCLGHDLFEGIVAYDLLLYVRYFIDHGWFTLKQLNRRIENFKYSPADRTDKPCTISTKNTKLPGGACQIWNFLRLFPLLIEDKIVSTEDDTWILLLLLSEIVEIICSPTIHKAILPYLETLIFNYLSERQSLFPGVKLRPKHHFTSHYPQLILEFGPLIKVWTMRYESKHRFFKRVVRYSLNFINIIKSLSIKHELLQSYIRLGADIRLQSQVYNSIDFQPHLFNADIQRAITNAGLTHSIQQCTKAIIKGTTYSQGQIVVLRQRGYRYDIILGKICMILCYMEEIYALFELIANEFVPHLNAYKLGKINSYECQRLCNIIDYKPLHIYDIGNMLCIKPWNGFVSYSI